MGQDNDTPETAYSSREITLEQAPKIISPILQTQIVPFLWGPPGVGKSSLIRDICIEKNWELIDLRLSLLNPVDLRGLPVINKENRQADWYTPSFLPKYETKEPGILFLDEINLAPPAVQSAAYQLILDKRVGEYRFPPTWKIIAAGNRETDRANVYKIPAPLANRFIHFTVQPDFLSWAKWARGKVRQEVISFLVTSPSLLFKMPSDTQKSFPTPRSWSFVSEVMNSFAIQPGETIDQNFETVVAGAVGESAAKQFMKFITSFDLQRIAKTIEDFVLTGAITLPNDLSSRYAITTAIWDKFRSGEISTNMFELFTDKLTDEERNTLYEMTSRDHLRKLGSQGVHTYLIKKLAAYDLTLELADPGKLKGKVGRLEISDGVNSEIVSYLSVKKSGVQLDQRGVMGTPAREFTPGSIVKIL